MALKPLDILKKGLARISLSVKAWKDELNAKLSRKETISSADEHWLDNEANTIDEQCVLGGRLKSHLMVWLLQGHFRTETEWTLSLSSTPMANPMF